MAMGFGAPFRPTDLVDLLNRERRRRARAEGLGKFLSGLTTTFLQLAVEAGALMWLFEAIRHYLWPSTPLPGFWASFLITALFHATAFFPGNSRSRRED